jgi:probable rRNA maturation factor
LKIKVFYDNINYRIRKSRQIIRFIEKVIRSENYIPGDLYFIITNDKKVLKINKEFLKRDSKTDVIAFDYSDKKIVNGEVYISINTVKRNANNYKVSLRKEIIRVMIHGTLHLCGYNDKRKREKEKMNKRENYWIDKIEKY